MIGKAILKEVASRAAASVMMHMDVKASIKDFPGLKTGFTCSTGTASLWGPSTSDNSLSRGTSTGDIMYETLPYDRLCSMTERLRDRIRTV